MGCGKKGELTPQAWGAALCTGPNVGDAALCKGMTLVAMGLATGRKGEVEPRWSTGARDPPGRRAWTGPTGLQAPVHILRLPPV
eukprot:CAMPEP_0180417338 /NCGR_PEP_ID=MMETSP1036_2-20121128/978_1 /TAXON_ID=632150 /ORGANISM="Azadinium spinosum, Strain 3D9" /LENGTH=83 /DNA_ID=CAMNT_0022422357 /DNA_START=158 /DNA_END=409 /DNA_ORIENTATION=-